MTSLMRFSLLIVLLAAGCASPGTSNLETPPASRIHLEILSAEQVGRNVTLRLRLTTHTSQALRISNFSLTTILISTTLHDDAGRRWKITSPVTQGEPGAVDADYATHLGPGKRMEGDFKLWEDAIFVPPSTAPKSGEVKLHYALDSLVFTTDETYQHFHQEPLIARGECVLRYR
jgi:hypothetical protein